jgi:hypothetical protein
LYLQISLLNIKCQEKKSGNGKFRKLFEKNAQITAFLHKFSENGQNSVENGQN